MRNSILFLFSVFACDISQAKLHQGHISCLNVQLNTRSSIFLLFSIAFFTSRTKSHMAPGDLDLELLF